VGGTALRAVAGETGSGGSPAPVSPVMPSLHLGQAMSEFPDVAGADQLPEGGVIAWRHGPVVAGGTAAPDPPPRIPLPEPDKLGIVVVLAPVCIHVGRRAAVPERAGS
jgi:hypothetical protein